MPHRVNVVVHMLHEPGPQKPETLEESVTFIQKSSHQGCQMVCFRTKNPNLGKFWRALEWKMTPILVCCLKKTLPGNPASQTLNQSWKIENLGKFGQASCIGNVIWHTPIFTHSSKVSVSGYRAFFTLSGFCQ
jgi:hypothetical protein